MTRATLDEEAFNQAAKLGESFAGRVLADELTDGEAHAQLESEVLSQLGERWLGTARMYFSSAKLDGGPKPENSTPLFSPHGFTMSPLDWDALERDGVPEVEWLFPPYIPARSRIWAWGPAEVGKSLWALWLSAKLTQAGKRVEYLSQENMEHDDLRRLGRLPIDRRFLNFYPYIGLDLMRPDCRAALTNVAQGAALTVVDTFTACWTGDENSNRDIAAFDREFQLPFVRETGSALLVIHHTGHAQPYVSRRGSSAGRGASALGQKADVVLEFRQRGEADFLLVHGKNRAGRKEPDRAMRIIDTDSGGLDVVEVATGMEAKTAELVELYLEAIEKAGQLTTKALKEAVPGYGVEAQSAALKVLEDDPRVVREDGRSDAGRPAKVWRLG